MKCVLTCLFFFSLVLNTYAQEGEPTLSPDVAAPPGMSSPQPADAEILNEIERGDGEGDRQAMEEDPKLNYRFDEPVADDHFPEQEYEEEEEW